MVLRSRARPRVYELQERIGVGGMGEVYRGTSPELNRQVAVKRMLDRENADDDLKDLFLREVAVAATLEHHNVIEVLDAGQTGHELYLVMEFVDGPALAEIVEILRRENKILPIEVSCGVVSSVALGLTHAHERALPDGSPLGIVHRDVAPENVLIGTDGVPKIVDFGLATLAGHNLTEPGIIRGRPRALSPEQARGDATDVRSDIFSLGAMLFELVAGQPLYPNEALATLLWKVAAGDYPALEPRLTHIDADLIDMIKKALAVDPVDRFRSTREMERALDHFRAARGMRMSSRALTQVVNMTWPAILDMRRERTEGSVGELEGTKLVLPADQLDWDLDQARSSDLDEYAPASSRFEKAPEEPKKPEKIEKPKPMPSPTLKAALTSPAAGGGLTAYPKPDLATSVRSMGATPTPDLARLRSRSEWGWTLYLIAVLTTSVAVFAGVWMAHSGN